ncbi:hypothetical protein BKA82DRAFT_4016116 [Pisolithus tinctorius]|nr:hypothetical protein BKA82DRAFT_4016116 [Pisolithus tinctorius]
MYITDKVSTNGWAHAWEDPSNKSYGEAHQEGTMVVSWMGSKPMDGPVHGEFYPTNDEVTTHGRARTSNVISDNIANHERANRRKIVPVATNGQGLWDISDPIKSKQQASPWVASPRRLGEAKPRWKTCSLSIWRLSLQPVEVSTVAIVDDSKVVDHILGANSCYAICQYMTARLHEEIVDGPCALLAISIPMQIACEADHILAVIIQAYRECVVIDKEGSILLWYLPNAISQAYQVDLLNFRLLAMLTWGAVRSLEFSWTAQHSTSTEPEVTWNGRMAEQWEELSQRRKS